MISIYNMEQFYDYDNQIGSGLGKKVIVELQKLIPNTKLEIKWHLPFVVYYFHKGKTNKEVYKNICYLTYKEKKLYLGFHQGVKFMDFHQLFEKTEHSFIKYYLVNELADVQTEEFRDLVSEAIEIAKN